ncbi:MAG: sensor histidine kinase, partial [Arthrobacter sp.]|nr:sensor histidine kinase [Arthrobacter sp.]
VTDDGGGIPPEFVDQVFARFARADAARTGKSGGPGASGTEGTSGLGLSIVESIVEAHGGKVTVTSQPGRTRFVLQLPLPQVQAQDGAPLA